MYLPTQLGHGAMFHPVMFQFLLPLFFQRFAIDAPDIRKTHIKSHKDIYMVYIYISK